jgi:hypothetical protein
VNVWSLKFMIMPNSPRRSRYTANNHIICAWWLRTVIYMKFQRIRYLFAEVELYVWKCHKNIPVLVVVNWPPIVLQVFVLLSSVLMNGAEVYASRMMLLLARISASTLSRCSSLLTMRLTTSSLYHGWVTWFCQISFSRAKGFRRSKQVRVYVHHY